jgi:hypothetical protein
MDPPKIRGKPVEQDAKEQGLAAAGGAYQGDAPASLSQPLLEAAEGHLDILAQNAGPRVRRGSRA